MCNVDDRQAPDMSRCRSGGEQPFVTEAPRCRWLLACSMGDSNVIGVGARKGCGGLQAVQAQQGCRQPSGRAHEHPPRTRSATAREHLPHAAHGGSVSPAGPSQNHACRHAAGSATGVHRGRGFTNARSRHRNACYPRPTTSGWRRTASENPPGDWAAVLVTPAETDPTPLCTRPLVGDYPAVTGVPTLGGHVQRR